MAEFDFDLDFKPSYNIAPTEQAPVIMKDKATIGTFGLDVDWQDSLIINTRSDSLDKDVYKGMQRCIVPADGFYEWKHSGRIKVPYRITREDEKVFAFPAMCKEDHFSIITVQPDQAVRAVHDRMPKVLDSSQARRWLGGEDVLSENGPALTLYQVTQKVNSPKDKTADVIRPERTLL